MFLFAIAINGSMLYRPAPAKSVPVASWLKTDKIQDRVPVRVVPVQVFTRATLNKPIDPISLPWSCETIRQAVVGLTRKQQDRLARVARLTDEQRTAAKRCLKEAKK